MRIARMSWWFVGSLPFSAGFDSLECHSLIRSATSCIQPTHFRGQKSSIYFLSFGANERNLHSESDGIERFARRFQHHRISMKALEYRRGGSETIESIELETVQWAQSNESRPLILLFFSRMFHLYLNRFPMHRHTSSSSVPTIEWLKTEIVSNVRSVVFHLRSIRFRIHSLSLHRMAAASAVATNEVRESWREKIPLVWLHWTADSVNECNSTSRVRHKKIHPISLAFYFLSIFPRMNFREENKHDNNIATFKYVGIEERRKFGKSEGTQETAGVAQTFTCHFWGVNSLHQTIF